MASWAIEKLAKTSQNVHWTYLTNMHFVYMLYEQETGYKTGQTFCLKNNILVITIFLLYLNNL